MAAEISEPRRGLTFEDVWVAIMADREEQRERHREIDRIMQETERMMQETSRKMQETDRMMKETSRRMQETDRKIGELGNRFGELAEHLVAPSITEKFNALGYHFGESSSGRKITWPDGKIAAEVDIFLENTEYCLAVEVKSKLLERHVDEHLKRLEIIKRYYTEIKHDGHSFLGAVAGAIMDEGVRNYAIKAGFYVITQTGDTVKIDVPPDFVPRKW